MALKRNTATDAAITNAPIVATMFQKLKP